MSVVMVERMRSETFACRIASNIAFSVSSSADSLTGSSFRCVDLLERRPILPPGALPLGRVGRRHGEEGCRAGLLGEGCYPLDQLLDPCPCRHGLAALEVDQLAGKAVADRAPEVFLEQPVGQVRERLALVDRADAAGGERVGERRERLRLGEVGLRVA